jgi:hypothetical protein
MMCFKTNSNLMDSSAQKNKGSPWFEVIFMFLCSVGFLLFLGLAFEGGPEWCIVVSFGSALAGGAYSFHKACNP